MLKILIIVLISITFWAPSAWSQTQAAFKSTDQMNDNTYDLPSLITEALGHNPEILSAQAKQKAAQAKIPQAWALKKPWFSYDVMGEMLETRLGPQEQRYGVMQEVPFPGKLPLRSHLAEFSANRIGHEFLHVRQMIRSQVISAYADLLEAQQILAVLSDQHSALEQVAAAIRAQYATGKKQATDAARMEVEIAKIAERILKMTDMRVAAEERLTLLLDREQKIQWPMLSVPGIPDVPFDIDRLKELTLEHRHGLVIKRFALKEAEAKHKLAKMEYLPDFEVGFNYIEIGGGTTTNANDGQDAWMIPIKVNLPLWEPQIRGQVREAKEMKKSAEEDVKNALNMAVADIIQKYTKFQTSSERIAVYEKTFIPQAEQAFNNTLAGYQGGNNTILDVLDSIRMLLEARIGYWESYGDTLTAYGAMEQAVGAPFDELVSSLKEYQNTNHDEVQNGK